MRSPRVADSALALLILLATVLARLFHSGQNGASGSLSTMPLSAWLLFFVGSIALLWRRSLPLTAHTVVLVCSALSMSFGYFDGPLIAIMVSLYSVGRYASNRQLSYFGVAMAIVLAAVDTLANSWPLRPPTVDALVPSEFVTSALITFLTWYAGKRVRARSEYVALLRQRAAQLEREKEADSQRAVEQERTRIARELHDVVAHQVSLMTVQAGAAKTVATSNPSASLKAIEAIEQAGHQALDELRHLLGVLRPASGASELGPQPDLSDLTTLIERSRAAGLSIELDIEGEVYGLPLRVGMSAYRIVQESLTNVLKHAGIKARARVRVRVSDVGVDIHVWNDGCNSAVLPESGHGIAGMTERANLLGGTLTAGPQPAESFAVLAHLPIKERLM
ncbi:sensor histidine kinase [Woeseia oceani]|uniref:histidine kinase n=1 Tax=Woeseia oceani TaxID=1548547 RepID=A0A193LLU0_9GAMM|nr:sensor histidine kinase [Woeseia oceani]ANO53354.1 hypothetical protein BA177_17395 [Woeseia oceani]